MGLQSGVKDLFETVPEESQAKDDPYDPKTGGDQRPPGTGAHRPAAEGEVQHLSPGSHRGISQPEKRQYRFVQDRQRDHENGIDHQQRQDQRQDVVKDDMSISCTDGARSQNEFAALYSQRL